MCASVGGSLGVYVHASCHKLILLHDLPFQVAAAVVDVLAVGENQCAIDIAPCMQTMSEVWKACI